MEEKSIIKDTVKSALVGLKTLCWNKGRVFRFDLKEEKATFSFEILADDNRNRLVVIGYFPVPVHESSLERMYKYINELNRVNSPGMFIINSVDGELTFRISSSEYGCTFNEDHVMHLLSEVRDALSCQYDGIMKELFGSPRMVFAFDGGKDSDGQ